MTEPAVPGAVLVITAWQQPGAPDHLIARISCTVSDAPTARTHMTVTGVTDIVDVVQTWLTLLTTRQ